MEKSTNQNKINVCVLMGGVSGEHEVSLQSAQSVILALDKEKYNIIKVGITKAGVWYLLEEPVLEEVYRLGYIYETIDPSYLIYGLGNWAAAKDVCSSENQNLKYLMDHTDIFFPVLHGPNGEDGTIQGLFEQLNMPYVGCGVLASSAAMDKIVAKNIFREEGLPVVDDCYFTRDEFENDMESIIEMVESKLSYPVFVKPANMGSSVGINKAKNMCELAECIKEAAIYDKRILVEEGRPVREIEVSVLGYDTYTVSEPGEILPAKEFYDYEAKYIDNDSKLLIPAPLESGQVKEIKRIAEKAFKAINGSGLSRVDFFLDKESGELFINEINTMPGFTSISMYPKLMDYSGVSYSDLLDQLIDQGFFKWKDKNKNRVSK